ncbi:MAG: lytic transglycosylase domain-containing protein [Defluviitaleaceae bacterium]|nr:lytic transglycosylase domain-containing protein [Defluviitaleaceae bacterium]
MNFDAIHAMISARINQAFVRQPVPVRVVAAPQAPAAAAPAAADSPSAADVDIPQYQDFQTFLDSFISLGGHDPQIDAEIDEAIREASLAHGIDSTLIRAIIRAESSYNPNAVSHAGAMGLMQLMPGTAAFLGVDDPFNIRQNIYAGTMYIARQLARFNGDIELALAAYNAGAGNVERFGGIPPFAETQTYVPRVLGFREEYIARLYAEHKRRP